MTTSDIDILDSINLRHSFSDFKISEITCHDLTGRFFFLHGMEIMVNFITDSTLELIKHVQIVCHILHCTKTTEKVNRALWAKKRNRGIL